MEYYGTRFSSRILAGLAFCLMLLPLHARAQTDEIQVYDASIAGQGIFNVESHTNFTPIGRKTPNFAGAFVANNSVNGAIEWAYGVEPWMEQGLYMPVWSAYAPGRGPTINGFKIRELFVTPHAEDREFFAGLNFEFSTNALYWEPRRESAEMRPILGVHLKPQSLDKHQVDLIFNPIMDTDYRGGVGGLEFVPSGRVAYHLNDKWAVAAEEYSDFGQLRHFDPANEQFQEMWATTNHYGKVYEIETGVGVGFTSGADKLTFKFMISRDLNSKDKK